MTTPTCAACNATIHWTKTANRRWMPTDINGVPHWGACPFSDRFRSPPRRRSHPAQASYLPPQPQPALADRTRRIIDRLLATQDTRARRRRTPGPSGHLYWKRDR